MRADSLTERDTNTGILACAATNEPKPLSDKGSYGNRSAYLAGRIKAKVAKGDPELGGGAAPKFQTRGTTGNRAPATALAIGATAPATGMEAG